MPISDSRAVRTRLPVVIPRLWLRLRLWLFAICALPALANASQGVETIPVDAIEPGMVGEGRTVFSAEKIETFKVTIMGVLRNYGPNQNMILAKLEGGPLAQTGVIAGMSGSPVYIDGKLIGAVAYSFPFSKRAHRGNHSHRRNDRGNRYAHFHDARSQGSTFHSHRSDWRPSHDNRYARWLSRARR